MINVGQKFEINPYFSGIAEIIGRYPKGQTSDGKEQYDVMIDGERIRLSEDVIPLLFREVL